jgi:hypothetical protein
MPIEFVWGRLAMPIYREISLKNLALYQQILRTAQRVKTLRREIDDISRELYQRLDDFDIIIEEIQGEQFADTGVVGDETGGIVCSQLQLASLSVEASAGTRLTCPQAGTTTADKVDDLQVSRQASLDRRSLSHRREREAIEEAAKEFRQHATKLIAVCRRPGWANHDSPQGRNYPR